MLKQILQNSFKPHAKFLQQIEILQSYMETGGTDMERLRNITLIYKWTEAELQIEF